MKGDDPFTRVFAMRSVVLALVALSWLPTTISAQSALPPGVSVTGSAELTKAPEIIRLCVKQYARGNDEDGAKSALIAAEKKLLTKLGEAGVEVVVSTPGLSQASPNLQSRYQNIVSMAMNRRALGGGMVAERSEKSGVFLERFVCVDLRPKNKHQDVHSLTSDLQEKLRKEYQELTGLSAAYPKEDPNDPQVNAQQMQMMRNELHYFQQDVRLYLAARIQREDRLKLYGVAITKARGVAEDLAGAAGVTLGELQSINSSFSTSSRFNNVIVSGGSYDMPGIPFFKDDPACEGIAVRQVSANANQGYQPAVEALTYQVTLQVTYRINAKN